MGLIGHFNGYAQQKGHAKKKTSWQLPTSYASQRRLSRCQHQFTARVSSAAPRTYPFDLNAVSTVSKKASKASKPAKQNRQLARIQASKHPPYTRTAQANDKTQGSAKHFTHRVLLNEAAKRTLFPMNRNCDASLVPCLFCQPSEACHARSAAWPRGTPLPRSCLGAHADRKRAERGSWERLKQAAVRKLA